MNKTILGIEGELLSVKESKVAKIAVIGCGSHSFRNIFPTFQFLSMELVALCDLNKEKALCYARKFGAKKVYSDYKKMLDKEQLDGVFLILGFDETTGKPLYPKVACEILSRGIPVWMEKPPSATVEEVRQMTAAAKRGKTFAQIGFKKMFSPAIQKTLELMNSKEFGKLSSFAIDYPVDVPENIWNLNDPSARRFLDDFVHVASIIIYLFGKPKETILFRTPDKGGIQVLLYESGIKGVIYLKKGVSSYAPLERLEIVGDNANLVLDNAINLTFFTPANRGPYGRAIDYFPIFGDGPKSYFPEFSLGQLYNKGLFLEGYYQEVRNFVECVISKKSPLIANLGHALQVMQLYESFSNEPNRIVQIGTSQLENRITFSFEHQYKCDKCKVKLVLKDGWNFKCTKCGKAFSYEQLLRAKK